MDECPLVLRQQSRHSRVVDVLSEDVESVVDSTLEVGGVEALSERLSPAHVHLAADELVHALQLRVRVGGFGWVGLAQHIDIRDKTGHKTAQDFLSVGRSADDVVKVRLL